MMDDHSKKDSDRDQIFTQVIFPFLLMLLLTTAGGAYLLSGLTRGEADFRMWSDIAVLLIFLPLILIGPVILAMIVVKIFFIGFLRQKLREIFGKIKPAALRITGGITKAAETLASPILAIETIFSTHKR